MTDSIKFTCSRPSARVRGPRPDAVPSETTTIKQEASDDDWHPNLSTSLVSFENSVENFICLDDDDVAIKQEPKDDSFITVDAWGGCGLTGKDPIILDYDDDDNDDVMINQEDPIVFNDNDVKIKQEPTDENFISVEAWGNCGLTGKDPIILNDGDDPIVLAKGAVVIKQEPKDGNFISIEAWGGCGLTDNDPIILDDEEKPSDFQRAHVESASSSEVNYRNEIPRNPNHALSTNSEISQLYYRSPGDIVEPSVELGPYFVPDRQTNPVYELVENEVSFSLAGFNDANAAAMLSQHGRKRSEMSYSESELYLNPSAGTYAGADSEFKTGEDKESSTSKPYKFLSALRSIRGQRGDATEPTAEELTESKPLEVSSQEPLNQSFMRPQAAEYQGFLPTPTLNSESRLHDEDACATRAFEDFEKEFKARQAVGGTSMEEDMQYLRWQFEEKARRKRAEEEAKETYQGRPASTSPEPDPNPKDEDWHGKPRYPSEGLFCTPAPPSENRMRSSRGEEVEMDANYISLDQQDITNHAELETRSACGQKRAGRADDSESTLAMALTTGTKKRGRTAGINNGQGKGWKKAVAKGRGKNADSVPRNRLLDTASLLTSNAIRDANANEAEPATYVDATAGENGQRAMRKDEALKRLLATVPTEQKKTAQLDRRDLLAATKHFAGHGACRPDGAGGWLVGGMKTALKNYQVLGAGFMRERERGVDEPRGGLCSDDMGFGKTIMTLANIVNDHVWRRRVRDDGPRTTLIVVPSTLATQWRSEIDKHVRLKDINMKVMVYRSSSRIDSNDEVGDLKGYDIVITTYYEIMRSFPKGDIPLELQTSQEKQEWWQNYFEEKKGLLHSVDFRRVVLDEAQQIKNHKGRTSLACRQIRSEFRWTLSATPILNSPLELYAYFKFLQVPSTGSFRIFKANYYGNNDAQKMQRLEVMLQKFMIRRTHKDTLFSLPILSLPHADEDTRACQFNDTERAVYDIVRKRMIARINSFSRNNTLQRNYSNVLVMLLRLRQMTGSILIIETVMRDLLEREDHEKLMQLTQVEFHRDELREAQIVGLRRMLAAKTKDGPEDPASSPNIAQELPDNDEDVDTGRSHGLQYNFSKYLCSLQKGRAWEELQARTLCSECRNPPEEPVVTSCFHIYCTPCLEGVQHRAALKGLERARCSACQNEYSNALPCKDYHLESVIQSQEMGSDNEGPTSKHWRKKKRGKKARDDDEVVQSWIEMNGSVLPSAKTLAIKAQILNWIDAKPNCKIIVYTQFLSMIRILSKVCNQEGWGFVEFHGKMSLGSRDATIKRFGEDPDARIMLASLKCGGIGLNLTMATHVVSVDPWWNQSLEQQAFGRVFRIGQKENTVMRRFIVEESIDEQLMAMQRRKQKQIDAVMGDANPDRKLSMVDMMRLFGPVEEDGQGKPFIVVENKRTVPRFNQDSEDEGDED